MEDALLLARAQFGLNIGFHILFSTLTIALAWFLLGFRLAYRRTRDPAWLATYKLWVKIFALTFAMGVVTGVTMSFQFGTNWPRYMTTVGAIAGPLLSYEVLTAFFLAGLSAWRLIHAPFDRGAQRTLRAGLRVAAALVPLQIAIGDLHGLNTLEHQPAKIAAIEAIWHTERGVPLVLFAIPNEEKRRNDYAMELPYGASLILRHDARAEGKGIDAFEPDRPPVAPLFFAFRAMVGIGVLMLLASWYGAWRTRRGHDAPPRLLWVLAAVTFSGWAATVCGWLVTEIGRQPWLVTGALRTAQAAGDISAAQLGARLTGYILTYAALFTAYQV